MLVMRFADVQCPAPLSLLQHFAAQYKSFVIIIYYYQHLRRVLQLISYYSI